MDNNLRPTRRPDLPSRGNSRGANNMRDRMRGAGGLQPNQHLASQQPAQPTKPPVEEEIAPPASESAQQDEQLKEEISHQETNVKPKKQVTLSLPSLPKFNFKKIGTVTGVILIGLIILGGVAFGITKLTADEQHLPENIKKQLSFVAFYPDSKKVTEVDKSTIKYDKSANLLIFVGTMNNGTKLTFSQQATPDTLKDIQPVYEALLKRLGEYSGVDSINGKVRLIKPQKLKGGQSAIANWKGTTINVRPSKNMPDDEWKRVFNNLIIVK